MLALIGNLSMMYTAGTVANIEPTRINATSQDASPRVVGIGDSVANNCGNDGDGHPMPIADANIFNVAING